MLKTASTYLRNFPVIASNLCCSQSSSSSSHSIYIVRRFLRKQPLKSLPIPNFEKRLDIVILGHTNVGKSVLLNTLVNSKIAATSRKRNTTRMEILGVYNHRNVQLAFYDTPGQNQS